MITPAKRGFVFGLSSAVFAANSLASTVNGRVEYFQGHEPLAARALIKPTLETQLGRFRFFGEGFLEADAFEKIPYAGDQRAHLVLQEAYAEMDLAPLTFRVGLQAVRWSDSWSLPSLDFWTARRSDRYFLDPLSEQLKHPLGALVRFALSEVELEAFASGRRPVDSVPNPFGTAEARTPWEPEGGLRAKFRVQGWDFTPVYAYLGESHHTGFSLSYALQSVVPKFEVGRNDRGAFFVVGGADLFVGAWTLLPQVTLYRLLETVALKPVLYFPIRYENGRNAFEAQLLSVGGQERFWGAEYRRSLNDTLTASFILQDYLGSASVPGPISSFNTLVSGGVIAGLRLSATLGF